MFRSYTIYLFVLFLSFPKLIWSQISFDYLEKTIENGLQKWDVPGLAIAIVEKGEVTYQRGFGYYDLQSRAEVDSSTIFALGSLSKAFTSTILANLLSQQSRSLDSEVRSIWPSFRVNDPYLSANISVRDILSHRTSLPGKDLVWYGNKITDDELLEKVKDLSPTSSFRDSFQYNNLMYVVAGHLIEIYTKKKFINYLHEDFFQELNMVSASADYSQMVNSGQLAKPYAVINGKVEEIDHLNLDMVLPAGGLYSNIADMTSWLIYLLSDQHETNLANAISATQQPQILLKGDLYSQLMFPHSTFLSYGLGWFIHNYRGKKIIEHTGNTDGFSSHITLVPEDQLGIIVLTNLNANFLSFVLMRTILDQHTGINDPKWMDHYLDGYSKILNWMNSANSSIENNRISSSPSLSIDAYSGQYQHPFYGHIGIQMSDNNFQISFLNGIRGRIVHWHLDTFQITWENPLLGHSYLTFNLNALGEIDNIVINRIGLFPFNESFKLE